MARCGDRFGQKEPATSVGGEETAISQARQNQTTGDGMRGGLQFSPISSPGGTRDLVVDLTNALEDDERISTVTVTSNYAALQVSGVQVNSESVVADGKVVAQGKGVMFSVSTTTSSRNPRAALSVQYTGDSGSADRYTILQPIVPALTR